LFLVGLATEPARAEDVIVPSAAASAAAAAPGAACEEAYRAAVQRRAEAKLVAALRELLSCADPGCGSELSAECSTLYSAIEQTLPSLVFVAFEATGAERTDVTVTVDGEIVTRQLDGKPVSIDPGQHEIVFTVPDLPPARLVFPVQAHDRFQQVRVVFAPEPEPVVPPREPKPVASQPQPLPALERRVPILSYVLGSVGVVALGAGVVNRVIGSQEFDELKAGCSPNCPPSDVDQVRQKYVLSNLSFGLAAAALAGAALVYVFTPPARGREPAAVGLAIGPHGASAAVRARF